MRWLKAFTGYAAPLFLIFSPVISYSDQAYAMHRSKSSAGFSLDIPLIMIVASLFRIFYYPGARFDQALLVQSFLNIAVQAVLLRIALEYRPSPSSKGGDAAIPFVGSQDGLFDVRRPYNFWRWKSPKPYWQFLLYLFIGLTILELVLSPIRFIYALYSPLIGYIALSVEATLPLPQILANARTRSCKGFRLSVLATWIAGDAMKMFWFFTSTTEIPWAFKLCGMFQAACDIFLGFQYMVYGNGDGGGPARFGRGGLHYDHHHHNQSVPMYPFGGGSSFKSHNSRIPSGKGTPTGRRTPILDKEVMD